jgi:hypothetical protein
VSRLSGYYCLGNKAKLKRESALYGDLQSLRYVEEG